MQRLVLFKLVNDIMEFVGYFDSAEMIVEYMTQIQEMIDTKGRENLKGEYLAIPTLYYELKKNEVKPTQTNESKAKS